jgi:hypothetical protein
MNVQHNNEVGSCNHHYRGKEISITYSEYVSVFLPQLSIMQCACALVNCHLWPVWLYHIFTHYTINSTVFREKITEHKMCLDFLYKFCLKHFSL